MSKKFMKDLFDVAQSHVDDNPRIKAGASFARYQQEFCKKFTSSIANRCSILFSTTNFYNKGASSCAGTCKYSCTRSKKNVLKFLKPYGPVCVLVKMVTLRSWTGKVQCRSPSYWRQKKTLVYWRPRGPNNLRTSEPSDSCEQWEKIKFMKLQIQ